MKNVSTALKNLLNLEGVNLCRAWKITLANGVEFFFTDLNSDLLFAGDVYKTNPGITVSAVQTDLNGGPSDAQIEVALTENHITKEMARRGSLDRAVVDVKAVDFMNPTVGSVDLFNGFVTQVETDDPGYCALSLTGNLAIGDRNLVELYSETCRNKFGDDKCGIDIATLGKDFTITEMGSRGNWFGATALSDDAANAWRFGKVTMTSGDSIGQTYEIGSFQLFADAESEVPVPTGRAFFMLKTRFRVEVGDTGTIFPGCNKFIKADCLDRFNNVTNFRGEPFVPNLSFEVQSDIVTTVTTRQTGTTTETVVVSDTSEPIPVSVYVIK